MRRSVISITVMHIDAPFTFSSWWFEQFEEPYQDPASQEIAQLPSMLSSLQSITIVLQGELATKNVTRWETS